MPTAIKDISDIHKLVDAFYHKVRRDPILGGVFNGIIKDRWPEHLEKMNRFWQTVLLGEHTYQGSPFGPHRHMPIDESHFERWLMLFRQTVDELFEGQKADEAKFRAQKMAEMFLLKINYHRGHTSISIQ